MSASKTLLVLIPVIVALSGPATAGSIPEKAPAADLVDLSLEQLLKVDVDTVRGASRYKQKVSEAPSSVTIVTAGDIVKYGYRTMADVLESVRGFYVTYDRNYSFVGVRGFGRPGDYNSRIMFMVDGHRLNDAVYGGVLIGSEFVLDIDLIERIEIVRGPTSSLYGTGAFFGMVNIITRSGKGFKHGEAAGSFGSLRTSKGRLTYGHAFEPGIEVLASASTYRSGGDPRLYYAEFDDLVNNPLSANGGFADHADGDRAGNSFTKLRFRDFTLEAATVCRDKTVPTAAYGTLFTLPSRTVDESSYLDLRYDRKVGQSVDMMARVYVDRYRYKGDYFYDDGFGTTYTNRDDVLGSWWGAEAQVSRSFGKNDQILFGAEYQKAPRQDQTNTDVDPYFLYVDARNDSYFWGTYLSGDFDLFRNVRLSAGVRYDFFSTFGSTTNPRLGLICTPSKRSVAKLLYGTAFRAPNAYELYYVGAGYVSGSRPLKPETITTTELVWEQRVGDKVRATVAGYQYRINELIDLRGNPASGTPLSFENTDLVEANGLELELQAQLPRGLEARVSYATQRSEVAATGLTLSNSPGQMAKANLIVPLKNGGYHLGLEGQYTSARRTLAGAETEAFCVANVTLATSKLVKSMELSATVYNLFDERYSDPGAPEHTQDRILQDGRAYRVKTCVRF